MYIFNLKLKIIFTFIIKAGDNDKNEITFFMQAILMYTLSMEFSIIEFLLL